MNKIRLADLSMYPSLVLLFVLKSCPSCAEEPRFQFFETVGAVFSDLFVELNGFKETLAVYKSFCRWTSLKSSTFSQLEYFSLFSRIQEKFSKKPKSIVVSKLFDAT